MATLLNMFSSGPSPIIRRRAKELLDVIHDVLRETLTSSVDEIEATKQPLEVVQTVASVEETASRVAEKQNFGSTERDIWAVGMNVSL